MQRAVTPGTERWLEWGQDSPEPGSRVRDANGAMVFSSSTVRGRASAHPRGKVVELVSPTEVLVQWKGQPGPELVESRWLLVLP